MAAIKPLTLKREKVQLPRVQALENPYVSVLVDHRILHLEENFEYLIPEIYSSRCVVGALVEVEFGNVLTQGIIIERYQLSRTGGLIKELRKVLSTEPYLLEDQIENVMQSAEFYAARSWDLVRSCVPPFSLMGERRYQSENHGNANVPESDEGLPEDLTSFLRSRSRIHCAIEIPISIKYWEVMSSVVISRLHQGAVLLLMPNEREVQVMRTALESLGASTFTISSFQGKSERYLNYLRSRTNPSCVIIGTRSAALLSLREGSTIVLCDDGDESHYERKSPTWNSRELVQLREGKMSTIYMSVSPSLEVSARVINQELSLYTFPTRAPIKVLSDSASGERNFFELIRSGLAQGSVLISVGATGYVTAFSCQKCRNIALCSCGGRLYLPRQGRTPICAVCQNDYIEWKCPWCEGSSFWIVKSGIERKAEEFGRAFPQYSVIIASSENLIPILPSGNHLVLSTPGVEPRGEYAAEIFLDLEPRLMRTTLRATEESRLQIYRSLSMLTPGGSAYFSLHTSDPFLQSIFRGKSLTNAAREIEERNLVHLPPSFLPIVISSENLEGVIQILQTRIECEIVGPFLRAGRKTILVKVDPVLRPDICELLRQINRVQSMRKLPIMTYLLNPYSLN